MELLAIGYKLRGRERIVWDREERLIGGQKEAAIVWKTFYFAKVFLKFKVTLSWIICQTSPKIYAVSLKRLIVIRI